MKETEVTVEVLESSNSAEAKLKNLGFTCERVFSMTDRYYSPISIDRLKNRPFESIIRNSFLLRTVNEMTDLDSELVHVLIYKDKIFDQNGDVIEEEKVQTYIDSAEKHAEIFAKAGLVPYATISSFNKVYKREDMEIVLQGVKDLGLFIEFEEMENMKNLPPQEKTKTLISLLQNLGLSLGTDFNCKKLDMYVKKQAEPEQ